MKIHDNIKAYRKKAGLSVSELAEIIGVNQATLYRYENGEITDIPMNKIISIAKALNVKWETLILNGENISNTENKTFKYEVRQVPLYGDIAAGEPLYYNPIDEYIMVSDTITRDPNAFALRVKGTSMFPNLMNNDIAVFVPTPDVDSGEIAALCVNGESYTIKKVVKTEQGMKLIGLNPSFEPLFFTWQEVEELPVTIFGKYMGMTRRGI